MLSFGYDGRGRLTSIKNGDDDTTTIQRDAGGEPTAIVGPYGQTTTLSSANGYLSRIENPAGDHILLEYSADGLMSKLTDARDGVHTFEYDTLGRLTRDTAADGSSQTLARPSAATRRPSSTAARAARPTYKVERTADGAIRRTVVQRRGPDDRDAGRQRRRDHRQAPGRHVATPRKGPTRASACSRRS